MAVWYKTGVQKLSGAVFCTVITVYSEGTGRKLMLLLYLKIYGCLLKQANKNFRVFKKPDFSKKSGFSETFMPENLWNLTYIPKSNFSFSSFRVRGCICSSPISPAENQRASNASSPGFSSPLTYHAFRSITT